MNQTDTLGDGKVFSMLSDRRRLAVVEVEASLYVSAVIGDGEVAWLSV
jgi:hypothetical protein